MKNRKIRISELVLVLSVAFLPSIIKSFVLLFTGQVSDYSKLSYSDYFIWIIEGFLSICLLFYILHKNNKSYKDIGINLKFDWMDILIGIGLMIGAGLTNMLFSEIINTISPDFVNNAMNPQNIGFLNKNYLGILFVVIIVFPLQEELIVRGFTMTEVFKLTESKTLAVIVSVIIQFMYHLYQGIAPAVFMLPYFIIFSFYFVRTGNLNPIIYSHIIIDMLNIFLRK